MNINIDLNILESEPAAQYYAKADRYLSSHQLLDFIQCPWLHRKKSFGLIEDTDSASYLIAASSILRPATTWRGSNTTPDAMATTGRSPSTGPFWRRCSGARPTRHTLAKAQRENETAIRRLLVCRERDKKWPTGYEEIRVLDVL